MLDFQLAKLKEWFSVYITKYHNENIEITDGFERKIQHTAFVCDNIKKILETIELTPQDKMTAEAAGLLHDIGRFPQLSGWGTFNDSESIDHGLLGVEVLLNENIIGHLSGKDQRCILASVKWHNKFAVPGELPEDEKLFVKLVRDADKLDILRIFVEYYATAEKEPHPLLEFGLPKGDDCSQNIARAILADKIADIRDVCNLNDIRLVKLSWLYDLNYAASKKIFKDRKYIEQTIKYLPDTPLIQKVTEHLHKNLANI